MSMEARVVDFECHRWMEFGALRCDWCQRRWPAEGAVEVGEFNEAAAFEGWMHLGPLDMCGDCYREIFAEAVR